MEPLALMNFPSELNYLYGKPASSAVIRTQPDDFKVVESLSFEPEVAGIMYSFIFVRPVKILIGLLVSWRIFVRLAQKRWAMQARKIVMPSQISGLVCICQAFATYLVAV